VREWFSVKISPAMKTSRRTFLKTAGTLGIAFAGLGSGRVRASVKDKPNILLILVDQDRYPMHTPRLNRPSLDWLRSRGMEFHNTFASFPLCSPSRSTILTGKYPHQVGIFTNVDAFQKNPSLSPRIPNLGRVFSEAGYYTAYFGKWHLTRRAHSSSEIKKYDFNEMHISNQLIAWGSDPRVLDNTARFIKKQKGSSQPWLCICAPINPHDIRFPWLNSLYGKIPRYPVSLPPNFTYEPGKIYPPFEQFLDIFTIDLQEPETEPGWLKYLSFYCFLTELIDRQIQVLFDALEESNQLDNTIIIYTSDHGEMGGSHGLVNKGLVMYEENLKIPLVIAHPDLKTPKNYYGLASNLDLVPTLCGFAGIKWPERLEGKDLSPIFQGKQIPERQEIFSEGVIDYLNIPWRGIRTKKWKYWHYLDGTEFLFDLEKDPYEIRNLSKEPAWQEILLEFRERVRKFRIKTKDPFKGFL